MAEEFKEFFQRSLRSVENLEGIVITDQDGVIILEVTSAEFPRSLLKPTFLATFGVASEKAGKLGFGGNKSITAFYSGHQVLQLNFPPLVVTLVANSDANTGLLYGVEGDIKAGVKELISALGLE